MQVKVDTTQEWVEGFTLVNPLTGTPYSLSGGIATEAKQDIQIVNGTSIYSKLNSVYDRIHGLAIDRPRHIFLTTTGNGQGNNILNGSYATPTDFYYQAIQDFSMYSLMISISDSGEFSQTGYGSASGLTNGVKFFFYSQSLNLESPLFNSLIIHDNFDYANMTHEINLQQWAGTAHTMMVFIDVVKKYGTPLAMKAGDKFIVRLQDNFSGLTGHSFLIGGKELN